MKIRTLLDTVKKFEGAAAKFTFSASGIQFVNNAHIWKEWHTSHGSVQQAE